MQSDGFLMAHSRQLMRTKLHYSLSFSECFKWGWFSVALCEFSRIFSVPSSRWRQPISRHIGLTTESILLNSRIFRVVTDSIYFIMSYIGGPAQISQFGITAAHTVTLRIIHRHVCTKHKNASYGSRLNCFD